MCTFEYINKIIVKINKYTYIYCISYLLLHYLDSILLLSCVLISYVCRVHYIYELYYN